MVIVSPWIDAEAVKFSLRFRPRAKNLVFWTLASERQKLNNFSGLASALATEASSDIYESQELGDEDEMHRELRLHAKLTAIDQSNGKGIIWLGSGNWTCPGIGLHRKNEENFELMVRLVLDSQATSWLGDIDTDLITDEEMVGDEESEDSETIIIKNRRLLIRLQLSWKVYPSSLYVRLLLRKGEKAVLKSKFKWLDLSALESSTFYECPKLIRLGRCSWSKLLRNGFEVLEVPISKDSILQSLISVTSDLGTEGGSVRIHVPAPDSVARRRSERVNERIHIDLVDILESLLSLQEGARGRRSKISLRHGKRKEYSASIDDYFRYLRLELIYLQIARDDEDADNKYERARDVLNELQLFTKHPGNNHRTDIQALIRDLEYVIEQARTMRRARAK